MHIHAARLKICRKLFSSAVLHNATWTRQTIIFIANEIMLAALGYLDGVFRIDKRIMCGQEFERKSSLREIRECRCATESTTGHLRWHSINSQQCGWWNVGMSPQVVSVMWRREMFQREKWDWNLSGNFLVLIILNDLTLQELLWNIGKTLSKALWSMRGSQKVNLDIAA